MARRKVTKPNDLADLSGDLPDLTDQQMNFVRGILEGLTGADAYRRAYDCSSMQQNTIWAAASRLRNDREVDAWLYAARQAHLGSQVVTKENHLAELERLKAIAVRTGNVGAAVQAEQLRGKVQGHYIERFEIDMPADPNAYLEELARIAPELSKRLKDDEQPASQTEH